MRRPNPDRIREAQRACIRARMTSERRVSEVRADELLAAWEAEAEARGIARNDTYRLLDESWLRERAGVG